MPFCDETGADKRDTLAAGLASGELQRFPGAMSPLVAMLCERLGFEGVYISGAALSADLGLPDIGLISMDEVLGRGHQIARVTALPAIIDIDTGFGDELEVARTIRTLEEAGLAGCHIEDQRLPKRCGHLDGKDLVSPREMVNKIRAAVDARRDESLVIIARTDAFASEGLAGAIDRARAYVDAGADAIFPEALPDHAAMAAMRAAVDVPLVANMTEFGKTDLMPAEEIAELGYNVILYPVTGLRLAMRAVEEGLTIIREQGTQVTLLDRMQSRSELYELLGYDRRD